MMISSPFGAGETVVEVGALKRARGAKNDRIDAIRAAHHALSRDEQGAPRSGGLREAMRMVFACREGVLVSRTKAGDMAHVQGEGIPLLEFAGCAQEQVRWRIGDLPACGTLQVQVFVVAVYQVVDGRAMAKVHVLHDTEVGERLEGAVDASPMNRGVALGNRGHDLLGTEVAPSSTRTPRIARRGRVIRSPRALSLPRISLRKSPKAWSRPRCATAPTLRPVRPRCTCSTEAPLRSTISVPSGRCRHTASFRVRAGFRSESERRRR